MSEALRLYRALLRQSTRFASFNFRQYAIRRVRDGFVAHRDTTDPAEIAKQIAEGRKALTLLSRQTVISSMYALPDLVVEKLEVSSP